MLFLFDWPGVLFGPTSELVAVAFAVAWALRVYSATVGRGVSGAVDVHVAGIGDRPGFDLSIVGIGLAGGLAANRLAGHRRIAGQGGLATIVAGPCAMKEPEPVVEAVALLSLDCVAV